MRLLAKIIVLLSVTKSLVGIEYPAPFLEKRVDLNNPAEALRLVRMVEIYPLLVERVGEQEGIITEQAELMSEQEALLGDYEEANNRLKSREGSAVLGGSGGSAACLTHRGRCWCLSRLTGAVDVQRESFKKS